MEHLSPRELYGGNLEGGFLYWGNPKDILNKALKLGVHFRRCPDFGEHGGTLLS
jgi:hypothetical protein